MSTVQQRRPLTQRLTLVAGTLFLSACASTQSPPINDTPEGPPVLVSTTEGMVRGVQDGDVLTFKGLPYAAPVAGLERWLPPKPPAKRSDVFDATKFGPACEQTVAEIPSFLLTEAGEITMNELTGLPTISAEEKSPDCLRLNIWTPGLPTEKESTDAPATATAEVSAPATVDGTDADAGAPSAMASPEAETEAPSAEPANEAQADVTAVASEAADEDSASKGDLPTPLAGSASATDEEPPPPAQQEPAAGHPVIVMIHGGGLTSASARHPSQEGTLMAKKGVVVVGINYRLGSIGFLAGDGLFEGDAMKGNRGFMDAVRALEWIRDNIRNFGGDPNNVTLMGQSGGGTAVWSILASPRSEGLVHRAVIMSGPINQVGIEDHRRLAKVVLEDWGAPAGETDKLATIETADAISTASTTTLVGSDQFGEFSRTYLPNTGAYGTDFMPDDVFEAIKKGRFDNIDLLVGSCADDAKASIMMLPLPDSWAIDLWNGYIGGLIADTPVGEAEMVERYKEAMPGEDEVTVKEQLQTDALYRVRALKAADLHSKRTSGKGRTYAYQFDWEAPAADGAIGAMHGFDVVFAFGNLHKYPRALNEKDGKLAATTQRLSDQVSDAVVSFAKTGQPSSSTLAQWPEYDAQSRKTMVFDQESRVVADPGGATRRLWE